MAKHKSIETFDSSEFCRRETKSTYEAHSIVYMICCKPVSSHVYKKQHIRIFSVLFDYRNDLCVEPDFFAFSSQINNHTRVVITSDNGRPFPRGKATLYDAGTHVPLAIRWPGGIKTPGRVIDDFVSLTDLAPTFLDLLDLKGLPGRTGRSLGRIFDSSKSGWIDPDRSFTLTGMERHTACRELEKGNFGGGYPMRAIRTKEHLLIHNFKPERWPMGDWRQLADGVKPAVRFDQLSGNTFVSFGDCDASPSKAWMSLHRDEPRVKPLFDLAFGKRPEFELYDLQKDPAQIHNVAEVSKYGRNKGRS